MAIQYNGTIIGTLTLCQARRVENEKGEYVEMKDDKGRTVYNRYKIQIRDGNCMAIFLHVYKQAKPEDPKRPWVHQLQNFIADEKHLQNIIRNRDEYKGNAFEYMLNGKLRNIKLNIYYKGMQTLAKYMTREGLKVTCYYKEPKKK